MPKWLKPVVALDLSLKSNKVVSRRGRRPRSVTYLAAKRTLSRLGIGWVLNTVCIGSPAVLSLTKNNWSFFSSGHGIVPAQSKGGYSHQAAPSIHG